MKRMIEIVMRGGTSIRIPSGRGDGMPYDLLLAALKDCQHWDDDEEEWRHGEPMVHISVVEIDEPTGKEESNGNA